MSHFFTPFECPFIRAEAHTQTRDIRHKIPKKIYIAREPFNFTQHNYRISYTDFLPHLQCIYFRIS
jgi:hypothetical protein